MSEMTLQRNYCYRSEQSEWDFKLVRTMQFFTEHIFTPLTWHTLLIQPFCEHIVLSRVVVYTSELIIVVLRVV